MGAVLDDATRILLVISVTGVALRYPVAAVAAQLRPVTILLIVAMLAMAPVSTGLAAAILGVSLGAALMLGTAVCPTDPVLASRVVTGKSAEEDLPAVIRGSRRHGEETTHSDPAMARGWHGRKAKPPLTCVSAGQGRFSFCSGGRI